MLREAFFGLKYGGLLNLAFLPIVISITGIRTPTDTATEAAVVSNAGGRVTADALQNIMVLDSFVGVGTAIVVHHTGEFNPILPSSLTEVSLAQTLTGAALLSPKDCGMSHTTDEMLKQKLKERTDPEHEKEVDAMEFRTIGE